MSLPRVGGLVAAWQGTPLGCGRPYGRGTEPHDSMGLRSHNLHCFASPGWSWGFAVSAAVEGEEHPSGPRQWGTLWKPLAHRAAQMCGYSPISRVMLLCALAPLGVWDVLQAMSQGVHAWALGKPICTLLHVQGPPGPWG